MRCRNCLTVMMDADPECPSGHSSAARALGPPPGPSDKAPGLALLLPIFGGAIGGALYAGLVVAGATASSNGSHASRGTGGSSTFKWVFGLFCLLGGGLFLMFACVHFCDTWTL